MEPDFWHDRWESGRIGFHLDTVNPWLEHHWPMPGVNRGARVFVPLCGKSFDMLWLLEQGYRVTGIEISQLAIEAFFSEHRLEAQTEPAGQFTRWRHKGLDVLCGDFFDLDKSLLGPVDAIYDRAALIAMPPALRPRYAAQLAGLANRDTCQLLITLDYNQSEMSGPPFSVAGDEVNRLFGDSCSIELVESTDVLEENAKFRDSGLTSLREQMYFLTHL
ncbi:MAG: thiopurine S-methyltransferase [Thiohalobacterales bacterium]